MDATLAFDDAVDVFEEDRVKTIPLTLVVSTTIGVLVRFGDEYTFDVVPFDPVRRTEAAALELLLLPVRFILLWRRTANLDSNSECLLCSLLLRCCHNLVYSILLSTKHVLTVHLLILLVNSRNDQSCSVLFWLARLSVHFF